MQILPIQYLRALAALMVVTHHAANQLPWLHRYVTATWGEFGVDLFFVISGFVMVLTTRGRKVNAAQFMRRRIVRLVPLYWALTLLIVAGVLLVPEVFRTTSVEPWHVVQSLLFIPHQSPSFPNTMWPLMVPGWTLNYEMFFYACFALTLGRFRWLAAGFVALYTAGLALQPQNPIVQFYTSYLILEFVAGGALGLFWLKHGASLPAWARWRSRIWSELGDASYSIYLTHLFTLGGLRVLWGRFASEGEVSALGFFTAALTASSIIGWLTYRWLERPLIDRLSAGSMSRDALASAR